MSNEKEQHSIGVFIVTVVLSLLGLAVVLTLSSCQTTASAQSSVPTSDRGYVVRYQNAYELPPSARVLSEKWKVAYVPMGALEKPVGGPYLSAEPDHPYFLDEAGSVVMPNDPLNFRQLALSLMNVPSTWAITTEGARVGIVDSGVEAHADLNANLLAARDVTREEVDGSGWRDEVGHGTRMAGLVGAVGANGLGLSGVAPKVELVVAKFLDGRHQIAGETARGYLSDLIAGLDYVVNQRLSRVVLVPMSGFGQSIALREVFQAMCEVQDVVIVVSSGNGGADRAGDNNDFWPKYPSSYQNDCLLSVAALDGDERLASYSNYGRASVKLAAPGFGVTTSTGMCFLGIAGIQFDRDNCYMDVSGTSVAASYVAGVVSLMRNVSPNYPASGVKAPTFFQAVTIRA